MLFVLFLLILCSVNNQQVEKARLEALSAFGNCPLNSLVVKKENFRSKLNASAKNAASGKDTARRLTR